MYGGMPFYSVPKYLWKLIAVAAVYHIFTPLPSYFNSKFGSTTVTNTGFDSTCEYIALLLLFVKTFYKWK